MALLCSEIKKTTTTTHTHAHINWYIESLIMDNEIATFS